VSARTRTRGPRLALTMSLALCSVVGACHRAPAVDPEASAGPGSPRSNRARPTTSASIFFGNLEGQIEVQRASIARDPGSVLAHRDLSGLLYMMARHHGALDEVQRAIDEVSRAIELDPSSAALYVMRAEQAQTLHRFSAARSDLERARELGAPAVTVDAVERELDYAQGRYDSAIPAIRRAAADHPTMRTLARLAILEQELGDVAAAERAFDEAEALIRDSSPIPVAWLDLQRGLVAVQNGQLERGVAFLREAVRRTPGYVAAEEHLAETLAATGQLDEAVARYEALIARSNAPQFKAALAELHRRRGRFAEADQLVAAARIAYLQLIENYPEAMAAHATTFFLGDGNDAPRALELALADVRLRPTSRAFTALARAHDANRDPEAARAANDRARALSMLNHDRQLQDQEVP